MTVERWQEMRGEKDGEWHARKVPIQMQIRDVVVHCLNPWAARAPLPLFFSCVIFGPLSLFLLLTAVTRRSRRSRMSLSNVWRGTLINEGTWEQISLPSWKRPKLLLSTQKPLGAERGTPHPSLTIQWQIWSMSQPLLQVTSRHGLFSFLLLVPQTPCQALGDTSFCWRGKYKWKKKILENSFRGTILKIRDAQERKMSGTEVG